MQSWYLSPLRILPGTPIVRGAGLDLINYPWLKSLRGPFQSSEEASGAALVWRKTEGKRSKIWVCLVDGVEGTVKNCLLYHINQKIAIPQHKRQGDIREGSMPQPQGEHTHVFQRGGACVACDTLCPHPQYEQVESLGVVCNVCGCLHPWQSRFHTYELPMVGVPPNADTGSGFGQYLVPDCIDDWIDFCQGAMDGTFLPSQWSWVVQETAIADPSDPEGFRYTDRVCIFIRSPSGMCQGMFPLLGEPSPASHALAERAVFETFGVDRICKVSFPENFDPAR